jgi:predicted transcriptional regulator
MPKQLKITFQVDADIKEALEKEAKELDRSVSWVILHRLRESLEKDHRLQPKADDQ